jgi:hypothetical protein
MRLAVFLAATAVFAGSGSIAPAQTNGPAGAMPSAGVETPPNVTPLSQLPPAADLSGLNLRIEADEVTMSRLRATDLTQQNAKITAVKPALPFDRNTWLPPIFWSHGRS